MATETKTVASSVSNPATSLAIRFSKVETRSANPKAPTHRYQIAMPAPFTGTVLEGPIFTSTEKGGATYSAAVPGGSFRALKADKQRIESGGKTYVLADDDPQGAKVIDGFDAAVKAGFLEFLRTGNPEQRISL